MGFRSTFITVDSCTIWPGWFKEKYKEYVNFPVSRCGCISSEIECKMYYGIFKDLPKDIQKAINWGERDLNFVIVFLHECGGITRCQIDKNNIYYSEPNSWVQTEGITHLYCYGCSDIETIKEND